MLRLVGWLLHLIMQVMLSYRNGIYKPELNTYILCAVKGFDACGYHSQHPHGRMPEKPLQILAPSKDQVTDQIYSSNLLWGKMSASFLRKEQSYT